MEDAVQRIVLTCFFAEGLTLSGIIRIIHSAPSSKSFEKLCIALFMLFIYAFSMLALTTQNTAVALRRHYPCAQRPEQPQRPSCPPSCPFEQRRWYSVAIQLMSLA